MEKLEVHPQDLPYLLASFSVQLATVYEMSENTYIGIKKCIQNCSPGKSTQSIKTNNMTGNATVDLTYSVEAKQR